MIALAILAMLVNRWIDDDTFDNQALIRDENRRVPLDTTQENRQTK